MIFVFVTTRPAVQGNFAINVSVCRERSCMLESDAFGVNMTVHHLLLPEKYCSIAEPAAPFSSVETRWGLSQIFLKKVSFVAGEGVKEKHFFPSTSSLLDELRITHNGGKSPVVRKRGKNIWSLGCCKHSAAVLIYAVKK